MTSLLITTVFANAPAATLTLFVGLAMLRYSVKASQLFMYGTILGCLLTLLRNAPLPAGVHIPLFALALIVVIRHLSKRSWDLVVLTGAGAHLLAAVGEGFVAAPIFMILGIPIEVVLSSPWLLVMAAWLSNCILVLVAVFIFARRRFSRKEAL